MIIFENPGKLDLTALTTFGVSVKTSERPIGFFGTGLKYALAVLLRERCRAVLYSGIDVITFDTAREPFRGQPFDFCRMSVNGGAPVPLGFTTELGKTWQLWMAYRELACNATDEGGRVYCAVDCGPKPGCTVIGVASPALENVHAVREEYFTNGAPDLEADGLKIWRRRRPSPAFFYRGVRVLELNRPTLFTYDETRSIELTEDRTVKNEWADVRFRLSQFYLLRCEEEGLLRAVITAPKDLYESELDFHGWGAQPSATFLRVTGELVACQAGTINATALRLYQEQVPVARELATVPVTATQQRQLRYAEAIVSRLGVKVELERVTVVEALGVGVLGMVFDGKIYLSLRAFDAGVPQVAATLLEETLHLNHGYVDLTRDLQNFLFERLIGVAQELLTGEPSPVLLREPALVDELPF